MDTNKKDLMGISIICFTIIVLAAIMFGRNYLINIKEFEDSMHQRATVAKMVESGMMTIVDACEITTSFKKETCNELIGKAMKAKDNALSNKEIY